MTPHEVAGVVLCIHRLIDLCAYPDRRVIDGGGFHAVVDPATDSPFPSANPNRIMAMTERGVVNSPELRAAVSAYDQAGAKRSFLWLTPGDQVRMLTHAVAALGYREFRGPNYVTMIRAATEIDASSCELTVRLVGSEELKRHEADVRAVHEGSGVADAFARTVGKPDIEHFLAFSGDRAVACGLSVSTREVSWLGFAATHPEFRGRGAQSALIAARVRHAHERGCRWCVSETLSILGSSLRNLTRAGFTVSHTARVFER